MIDVSEAIHDPDLGYTPFTIRHTKYRRSRGTLTPSTRMISADGCIHPGTPEMLQLLPEEDRKDDFIIIYTSHALSTGENTAGSAYLAADQIEYQNKTWRVVKSRDWQSFGYTQALAVLVQEEDTA